MSEEKSVFDAEKKDSLDIARNVLRLEAEALQGAANSLNKTFLDASEVILNCSGKVIVTGLGKSGHVARKVAATLASTGTPAFFLHPAEGLHGDLGMLSEGDCLIAIAFGGETSETINVASFAKRRNLPVISITGKLDSTLAKISSFVLDGRVLREACPLNLAPTTSTTLAMALGDALAVTVMSLRGFEIHDFAVVHPAGSLGRRLSRVEDHMRQSVPSLQVGDDFHKVLQIVTSQNFGIAAVLSGSKLVGAITDGDLRRALIEKQSDVFTCLASDLMSPEPKTIHSNALAIEALQFMEENRIGALFVLSNDSGNLRGIVRMFDLLEGKVV